MKKKTLLIFLSFSLLGTLLLFLDCIFDLQTQCTLLEHWVDDGHSAKERYPYLFQAIGNLCICCLTLIFLSVVIVGLIKREKLILTDAEKAELLEEKKTRKLEKLKQKELQLTAKIEKLKEKDDV